METTFGRRDFLKGASVLGAAALGASMLGGCAPKMAGADQGESLAVTGGGIDPASVDWDYEADVVVVGSGSAAMCAAIETAAAGSEALVFEKGTLIGGDSALCGGVILAAGWSTQEELTGYAGDTGEAFAEQMVRWSQGMGDPEIIREACLRSGETVDWLISIGRTFDAADILPPIWSLGDTEADIVPRSLWLSGEIDNDEFETGTSINGHYKTLQAHAETFGDLLTVKNRHEVTRLLQNDAGEVIGVEVSDDGKTKYAKARKAVVLACASVDNNTEMARELGLNQQFWGMTMRDAGLDSASAGYGATSHDVETNTGDGIRMAREIGAQLRLNQACCMNDNHYIGGIAEYATGMVSGSNEYKSWRSEGNILVNQNGRRFCQEDAEWGYVVSECANAVISNGWQPEDPDAVSVYFIVDADHTYSWLLQGIDVETSDRVKKADTIEELAELINVPAENLKEEIETWNRYCETGKDLRFGRRADMGQIVTPPFYADPMRPGPMGSYAGVKANIKAEVIGMDGNPIPRLYAAGAVAGGNYVGSFYPGCGWAILNTCVWGREAGQNAAALEPWE